MEASISEEQGCRRCGRVAGKPPSMLTPTRPAAVISRARLAAQGARRTYATFATRSTWKISGGRAIRETVMNHQEPPKGQGSSIEQHYHSGRLEFFPIGPMVTVTVMNHKSIFPFQAREEISMTTDRIFRDSVSMS